MVTANISFDEGIYCIEIVTDGLGILIEVEELKIEKLVCDYEYALMLNNGIITVDDVNIEDNCVTVGTGGAEDV